MSSIAMIDGQQLKCKLTFDNGKVYECSTTNTDDKVLQTARINESEGITSGNPLGIMSSNSVNVSILDSAGVLVLTNASSPYAGYMRNGVKMELTLINKDGSEAPFGTYYTDDWDTKRSNGGYETTNLNGKDYLDYIGNMEIPELDAFASVEISELLVAIFEGLGLKSDQYYINPSLNLELTFSVTKGAKVRDTLNAIANALIASITISRNNVIQVNPAFPTQPAEIPVLESHYISDTTIGHNRDSQYNEVRLDYVAVGIQESVDLARLNSYRLAPGPNSIDSVEIPSNTQGIDGIFVSCSATHLNYAALIGDIDYTGYQGGISISIESLAEEAFDADIVVSGRTSGSTRKSIYAKVGGNKSINTGLTLMLTSEYIQSDAIAKKYIADVADYLSKIAATIRFNCLLSPVIETSSYVQLENTADTLDGIYFITGLSFNFSETYSVDVTAIKIS